MENRRNFVAKVAAGLAATGLISVSKSAMASELPIRNTFVHHVFFWLKEPDNQDSRKQFEKGLSELAKVPQIQSYHIGQPVESPREVVDDTFTYSFLVFFKNKEDQEIYQKHPIHLKFIEDCQLLWSKVVVYDAM